MNRRENLIRTITRDHPGWIPYRYDGCLTTLIPPVTAVARDGGVDDWGVVWRECAEGSYPVEQALLRLEEVDAFRPPQTDWEQVTDVLSQEVQALRGRDTLVVAKSDLVLYDRVRLLLGTTECLMAAAAEPDRLALLLDRVAEYQQDLTRAIARAGVDSIRFTDDWGMQQRLFLRPEQWRRLIKPRLQVLYRIAKSFGCFVFQHSCGHIDEIVPDLIEIGLDVLDPCQPQSNDIFRWKREYGSVLSFMGGLDTQGYLSLGTPAQVRASVREVVAVMGGGGGYIAAPSHTITIPPANRQAMLDGIADANEHAGH